MHPPARREIPQIFLFDIGVTMTVEKYIAKMNAHEMACRIAEAISGLKRPAGTTAEEMMNKVRETNPIAHAQYYRAAGAAAKYIEEAINAHAKLVPVTAAQDHDRDHTKMVRWTKASERERLLAGVIIDALVAADLEFTEEEIHRAAGLAIGAIAVVIFNRTPQTVN